MKRTKAIFAFSGDPVTTGHIDIIRRASEMFDLIIGVGNNPDKQYILSRETRISLINHHLILESRKEGLEHLKHLPIVAYDNSFTDFAYSQDVKVLVKGIRNSTDVEYEKKLFHFAFDRGFEKVFLFARPELEAISSKYVRTIVQASESPLPYITLPAKAALEKALLGQTIIGVTGEIGSGKSHLCKTLCRENGTFSHLDLDAEVKKVYTDTSLRSERIRQEIRYKFGGATLGTKIVLKELAAIVFQSQENVDALNNILREEVHFRIREFLRGRKGIILLDSALLIEAGLDHYCNRNVLFVKGNYIDKKRAQGIENAVDRKKFQLSYQGKIDKFKETLLWNCFCSDSIVNDELLNWIKYTDETYTCNN
jgi:pantetheine-phosphate adenylyltransferase